MLRPRSRSRGIGLAEPRLPISVCLCSGGLKLGDALRVRRGRRVRLDEATLPVNSLQGMCFVQFGDIRLE